MKSFLLLLLPMLAGGADHRVVPEGRHVRMILRSPGARTVQFASSLDGFRVRDMATRDRRTWEIRLPSRRAFRYFFLVDGKTWVPDSAYREPDGFGSENCVYEPGM